MLQLLHKLRDWWNPPAAAPSGSRRFKNYAAHTGFQYRYQLQSSQPGDYRFLVWAAAVTPARAPHQLQISVALPGLSARDRYALAKLRLFEAFDTHPPAELPAALHVRDSAALDELQSL